MLFHNNNTEKYYRVIRSPVLITFPDDEENQKVNGNYTINCISILVAKE